ncbi:VOC family protein [Streptosporangium sp. CA-135522]|uniref:VOC family protein n=1 Tax=Streptosporangium sp. CA-135522 TaxID=3240072 RepID=UPI003D90557A
MPVTLNHAIVPALDNERAARFFAEVMGIECPPPGGSRGRFAPVRVNASLTFDYMTVDVPRGHHLAFDVDPVTFDGVLTRLRTRGVPYGNSPADPANGRIDHPLRARGLFFVDDSGNLYEVMSPE